MNQRPLPLVLAEDGITDPIAIGIAASGLRPVALTRAERAAAAALILARGGGTDQISRRLHVSGTTARRLAAAARAPRAARAARHHPRSRRQEGAAP